MFKKILVLLYIILGAESFAEVILNLGWLVDTAVVSEVLLFRLHIIYGLLLGSVLQPRDGAADPFEQLEAERKTRKKTKIRWWEVLSVQVYTRWKVLHVLNSHHWPASHSPPSFARSPGWQPILCRYDLRLSQPIRKQSDESPSQWLDETRWHQVHSLYSKLSENIHLYM